jgi:protein-tyrosine phosphatase
MKRLMSDKQPLNPRQFVVGREEESFRWFLSQIDRETTDDLDQARRFAPLSAAVEASIDHSGSVFEIGGPDSRDLREIMVDLEKVDAAPYDGCYRVGEFLIAGPTYITESVATSASRVNALVDARVKSVISLVSKGELFWMREKLTGNDLDSLFQQNYFPIRDGAAPSRDIMRIILNTIDRTVDEFRVTFVHCIGGRGRTGVVIGCWLARHGIATGDAALDALTELRFAHGLFESCPESVAQRQVVIAWKEGE